MGSGHLIFGTTGKSFAEAYQSYHTGIAIPLAIGIDPILSTVLVDATLVWDLILFFA